MAVDITMIIEAERECGDRAEGGYYMVASGHPASCGRLPLEVSTCPTCGQGVKPARGWSWVDTKGLVQGLPECHEKQCQTCPLGGATGRHGLLWVGSKFYKTPEEFLREADKMGICRKLNSVPNDFELGKHWVLLGHRQAIEKDCFICGGSGEMSVPGFGELDKDDKPDECLNCSGIGTIEVPGIFYAYQPEAIEYVVKGDETEEQLERLDKRGITPVKVVREKDATEADWAEADLWRGCQPPAELGIRHDIPNEVEVIEHQEEASLTEEQIAYKEAEELAELEADELEPTAEELEAEEIAQQEAAEAIPSEPEEVIEAPAKVAQPTNCAGCAGDFEVDSPPLLCEKCKRFFCDECYRQHDCQVAYSEPEASEKLGPELDNLLALPQETTQHIHYCQCGATRICNSPDCRPGKAPNESECKYHFTCQSCKAWADIAGDTLKPQCDKLKEGESVLTLLGRARLALKKAGFADVSDILTSRVIEASNDQESLKIIAEYVELV